MSQVRPMIRNLAGYVTQLAQETNAHLNNLSRQQETTNDVVAALIRVVGEEQVQEALKGLRAERQKAMEDQQDAATKKLVDGGALAVIPEVTANCLLVGTDKYKDGRERKVRFEMEYLAPEAAAKFLGKKVGDTVVNEENGVTFTVVEIYSIDKAKVEAILAPQAPATAADNAPQTPENVVQPENELKPSETVQKKGKKSRKARA